MTNYRQSKGPFVCCKIDMWPVVSSLPNLRLWYFTRALAHRIIIG